MELRTSKDETHILRHAVKNSFLVFGSLAVFDQFTATSSDYGSANNAKSFRIVVGNFTEPGSKIGLF